ncbi:hypothetical protein PBRA_003642 [Plasmodiophora brassicae]|nr:hypothetical protein PBRA_003642 [Plasmodiophora brassicae]
MFRRAVRVWQTTRAFRGSPWLARQQEFLLADIGEGIAEVEVLQWFVKPGDRIQQFDKICEVQSDKATVEITSRFDGVIASVNVEKGAMAAVGSSLVTIDVDDDGSESTATTTTTQKPQAPERSTSSTSTPEPPAGTNNVTTGKVLTTPAVRRISREYNIDLSTVTGTGPGGRILKEDVLRVIESGQAGGEAGAPAPSTGMSPMPPPTGSDRTVPITGLARIMVKSMTASNQIPTLTLHEEIVASKLHAVRTELKTAVAGLPSLSYFPFILKAVSLALLEYPTLNALVSPDCSELHVKAQHNISIAMDTPRGLVVPVIQSCNARSISDIALELQRLSGLGQRNALGAADLQGGTFCLSNIGTIGGTYSTPLLVSPQVVIGGVGRIQRGIPRFGPDGQLTSEHIMTMSWSADHRVLDGAIVARFSNRVKSLLESPHMMLLHLK